MTTGPKVTTLLVSPDDRRRGRLLLKAAVRAARLAGCGTLQLCANENQAVLMEFCRANGFIEERACYIRPLRKHSIWFDKNEGFTIELTHTYPSGTVLKPTAEI